MSDTPQSPVSDELLDALFKHYEKPEDFFGKSGILEQLTIRVVERALQAELSHHLGHEKHVTVMNSERNTRNGRSKKTLRGQHGNLEIVVPCDTKAVYLALGVNMEGRKELLGLWISVNDGAKFWLSMMTEIQQRRVQYIFIAYVDGLKGFPEAIESVFPRTDIHLCIVHMVRNSLRFVSWKQRKEVASGLKEIYTAPTVQAASDALSAFEGKWGAQFPLIGKSWRANWDRLITFFQFPEAIRKVVYTTNAIESLNMSLRKIIKNRASFSNDEAAFKLIWLALNRISKK